VVREANLAASPGPADLPAFTAETMRLVSPSLLAIDIEVCLVAAPDQVASWSWLGGVLVIWRRLVRVMASEG